MHQKIVRYKASNKIHMICLSLYLHSYFPLNLNMYWWSSNRVRCWRSVYRDWCLTWRIHQNFAWCKASNKIHMICLCLYCIVTSRCVWICRGEKQKCAILALGLQRLMFRMQFAWFKAIKKIVMIFLCLYLCRYFLVSLSMYWRRSNSATFCLSVYRDSCLAFRMYKKSACCK
jgi:hypothetical protein